MRTSKESQLGPGDGDVRDREWGTRMVAVRAATLESNDARIQVRASVGFWLVI